MLGVILRLIPCLYGFVAEMYRRDRNRPPTGKARTYYRVAIAMMLSIIIIAAPLVTSYIWTLHNTINGLKATIENDREKGYTDMADFVPRATHEEMVKVLRHKISRALTLDEIAMTELDRLNVDETTMAKHARVTQHLIDIQNTLSEDDKK